MTLLNPRHPQRACIAVMISLLTSHSLSASAFSLSSSSSRSPSSASRAFRPTAQERSQFLYVDSQGNGEFSRETVESSKGNEWGIPDCRTLDPFSKAPVEQLGNGGKVTLVGSGPGDPDLLTVKAFKLLQDPDALVIVDRLVSQEILDVIKGEVKIARKLPGCADLAQDEIYWWTYQGLKTGKHVIRLKIGDPFVFGRGGEEILMFRRFGVESKVVPVSDRIISELYECQPQQ